MARVDGDVRAVPGVGAICLGGGSIGIGTRPGSPTVLGPPGAVRQFLHRAEMGTSVRHGSSQSLTPRLCSTSKGMRSPCTTCFAARCATRARRVRVTNASGHDWMGHIVCVGTVVRGTGLGLVAGGCALSSSLVSFAFSSSGAPHPIRTGNVCRWPSRITGAPVRGARWLPSPRVTRSWPWTALMNRAPGLPRAGSSVLWRFAMIGCFGGRRRELGFRGSERR